MRSVQEHLAHILASVKPTPPLEVALADAAGCVLVEDIVATHPLPGFDNSAMDGYAVRSQDVAAASPENPVRLRVLADLPAGTDEDLQLVAGATGRIMTGAPVPASSDAIVPIEDTDRGMAVVEIYRPATPGAHIRRAGEDVQPGDTVLRAGQLLHAPQIAAAAGLGLGALPVHPRPRVVVISTGSELVEPGKPLRYGQLPDSNSYLLATAAAKAGAAPYRIGAVPDRARDFREVLEDQLVRADVVITSGGVSVGAFDVVKEVLAPLGTVRFDRVAMQPGKPQGFGTIGDGVPIFALPGNPVSAYVSFEVFVRPALQLMRGLRAANDLYRPVVRGAVLDGWRTPSGGRRQFMPVTATMDDQGKWSVRRATAGGSGSHLLGGLANANGLAVIPENATEVAIGQEVTVMLVDQ